MSFSRVAGLTEPIGSAFVRLYVTVIYGDLSLIFMVSSRFPFEAVDSWSSPSGTGYPGINLSVLVAFILCMSALPRLTLLELIRSVLLLAIIFPT